jgi:hypothetical protein
MMLSDQNRQITLQAEQQISQPQTAETDSLSSLLLSKLDSIVLASTSKENSFTLIPMEQTTEEIQHQMFFSDTNTVGNTLCLNF